MQHYKKRVFNILQMGYLKDFWSKAFDVFISVIIILNLFVTLFSTFEESIPYANILYRIEFATIIIFTIEYILRLWTSDYLYPYKTRLDAAFSFIFSFFGIVDLLTILPFYLPTSFSSGIVAFRMLRVVRIFHLFKINTYYDSFSVITNVLKEKKNQILSSVFLVLILMVASSMCMYSLEHEAQPEQFKNAFSGIWWSVSTLLTVGYGDIYPITPLGKLMAIVISFLGVGMVAIPTGIISAGFVEQYTKIKTATSFMDETNMRFVVIRISEKHPYKDRLLKEIEIPMGLIVAAVVRNGETILPRGNVQLQLDDKVILGAEAFKDDLGMQLNEIIIKSEHPWAGKKIRDLDISRQTLVVMIRRKNNVVIPNGDVIIRTGDIVFVYSKKDISGLMESIKVDL